MLDAKRRIGMAAAGVLMLVASAAGGEILFESGPQNYAERNYYWLAEWKLEVTLPDDVAASDEVEVLFGSKGTTPRAMFVTYDGKTTRFADVGADGYQWRKITPAPLRAGAELVLFGRGRERVAFLAGVRITGAAKKAPRVVPVRVANHSTGRSSRLEWADISGFVLDDAARKRWNPTPDEPDWERARRSARYAGIALTKVQRWLRERCLPIRDEKTGLFRATGGQWNYRDTAADCYPFYIWAAHFTDEEVLRTIMVDTLEAEQRLCNRIGRLPVPYDMDKGAQIDRPFDAIIFGASEYAKDGLTPIVEILGPDSPWFARLRGIVDDIFAHARIDTPYGKIPSTNIEVNGELLQILPRLFRMTGEEKYLDWAHRLADYYLLPGKFVPGRLSDHGCEIIGGLGLLFAVDSRARPAKCAQYRPHLEYLFDEVLRRGRNSDGVIVRQLHATPGPHDDVTTGDGWGYDLVGFFDYDLALGTKHYRDAIRLPLGNLLKPRYERFDWSHGSRDNVADSVEGGLYLLYREPVTAAFVWADREIATLLVDHTQPDRLWGTHKLEANTVRTVLIHTMLHTRNTIARPWRRGLELGGAPCGDGVCLWIASPETYEGRLQFDIPRHRLYMGFTRDWPRMNTVPEWFTVEPTADAKYDVLDVDARTARVMTGRTLRDGLPIRIEPDRPLRLIVRPRH